MVTAALDEDGNIWSWGPNMSGGLGTNDAVNKSFPGKVVPIGQYSNDRYTPPGDFIKYITNNRTGGSLKGVSIIINTSSYAWAWGGNSGGWLANNTMAISSSPISIIGNLQFMDLAITKAESGATDPCHILGLDISSYAWAWGENTHGQLGDNTTTYMSDAFSFIYTSFNNRSSPVSVVGGKQWIKLLAGNFHSVGLDLSSYVWCWGDNTYGQLGDGSRTLSSSPVSVLGGIQAIDIAAGLTHSVLLSNSSYVWAWGANTYGQLGINSIVNYSSPVSVIGNQQFKQITSNCANSIWGLNLSSYVWSWGNNSNGILGNNVTANSSSPISVIGNRQFIYVTGSVYSVVALNASSYAWSWGNNGYAQLGDYSTVSKSSPVSVVGGYQWSNIDIGSSQIGVQSYPNSIIVACGSNADNRMTNYLSYIYNLSSPVAIVTKHSYLRPIPANWKNILGK